MINKKIQKDKMIQKRLARKNNKLIKRIKLTKEESDKILKLMSK